VEEAARRAGFLVNAVQPDAIRLAPPLVLTIGQAESFIAALPGILGQVAKETREDASTASTAPPAAGRRDARVG